MKKKKKMMNNSAPRDFCKAAYELADESYRREVSGFAAYLKHANEALAEEREAEEAEEKQGEER